MIRSITAIAREAGQIILDYKSAAIHQKEGHFNFVTDADVAVQEFLRKKLLSLLPGVRFFSEEQENDPLTDSPTFVVDPIDGTINFMRHRDCSAVSIALLKEKKPVLGVIYNPFTDEMFTAEPGKGAFCNDKPIHVSAVPFENAVVSIGTSPYDAELAEKGMKAALQFLIHAGDLRRTGSAALDLCDVARGCTDVFFELRLRPWDYAAGSLIVCEAGGVFRSLGHCHPYFDSASGVLACNPACSAEAWKILKDILE